MSAAAYFGSEHRWPGIISAINFLLVSAKLKDISEKGRVFRSVPDLVREIMELDMLIKQCWLDIRRRAQPPVTAGMVRWGTVLGAAEYLDKKGPLLAHAVIKWYRHGLEESNPCPLLQKLANCFLASNGSVKSLSHCARASGDLGAGRISCTEHIIAYVKS